jgi:hypothetical protein
MLLFWWPLKDFNLDETGWIPLAKLALGTGYKPVYNAERPENKNGATAISNQHSFTLNLVHN